MIPNFSKENVEEIAKQLTEDNGKFSVMDIRNELRDNDFYALYDDVKTCMEELVAENKLAILLQDKYRFVVPIDMQISMGNNTYLIDELAGKGIADIPVEIVLNGCTIATSMRTLSTILHKSIKLAENHADQTGENVDKIILCIK